MARAYSIEAALGLSLLTWENQLQDSDPVRAPVSACCEGSVLCLLLPACQQCCTGCGQVLHVACLPIALQRITLPIVPARACLLCRLNQSKCKKLTNSPGSAGLRFDQQCWMPALHCRSVPVPDLLLLSEARYALQLAVFAPAGQESAQYLGR